MAGLAAGLCTAVMSDESGAAASTLLRSRDERSTRNSSTLSWLLVAQLLLLLARGIGVERPDSCWEGNQRPASLEVAVGDPLGVAWPSDAVRTTPSTVVLLLRMWGRPIVPIQRGSSIFRGLGKGPPKVSKRSCETRRALGITTPPAILGGVDPDPPPLPSMACASAGGPTSAWAEGGMGFPACAAPAVHGRSRTERGDARHTRSPCRFGQPSLLNPLWLLPCPLWSLQRPGLWGASDCPILLPSQYVSRNDVKRKLQIIRVCRKRVVPRNFGSGAEWFLGLLLSRSLQKKPIPSENSRHEKVF
jgi:hypothetical protein